MTRRDVELDVLFAPYAPTGFELSGSVRIFGHDEFRIELDTVCHELCLALVRCLRG